MTMDLIELNNRIKEMSDDELNEFYQALRQRHRDKDTGEVITKKSKSEKAINGMTKEQMLALLQELEK